MKKKIKLLYSFIIIFIALNCLCFGVYSSIVLSQNNICFETNLNNIQINAKIYCSDNIFDNEQFDNLQFETFDYFDKNYLFTGQQSDNNYCFENIDIDFNKANTYFIVINFNNNFKLNCKCDCDINFENYNIIYMPQSQIEQNQNYIIILSLKNNFFEINDLFNFKIFID